MSHNCQLTIFRVTNKCSCASKEFTFNKREPFTPETNDDSQFSKKQVHQKKIVINPIDLNFNNKIIKKQLKQLKTNTRRLITERDTNAAIVIQRIFRGFSTRKYIDHLKE